VSEKRKRDEHRARTLRKVLDELKWDRGTHAAQLFRDAEARGLFPAGDNLPRWLIRTIGKNAMAKLVNAFVQFPCFCCSDGLQTCEACDGSGTVAGESFCETCAALGTERCRFCGGSGWVTYGVVPPGLRLTVMTERVNRASRHVAMLLQKPIPQDTAHDPVTTAKQCATQLLELNRGLGTIENAVAASKDLARLHPDTKDRLARLVGLCCRVARQGQVRVRQLVRQMGICSEAQAEAADTDTEARRRVEKGARFYASLAASKSLAGTTLEHPLLQRAIAKKTRKSKTT
jgi:hypothetical protein